MLKISINNRNNFSNLLLEFLMRRRARNLAGSVQPLACLAFDSVAIAVNVYGSYEKDEIFCLENFLDKYSKDKMRCALDIGANIGNHTVRLLQRKFQNVECFEPNEILCNLLKINTATFPNVKVHNLGLSNENKRDVIVFNETNWGGGMVGVQKFSYEESAWREISIELATLDSLMKDFPSKIDFIKLDAEGHEHKVLEGAIQLLKKHKPIIAFEEHNIDITGTSAVVEVLRDLNYVVYQMSENFYLGEGRIPKIIRLICQDLFGKKVIIKKSMNLDQRLHHLLIAVPA